MTDDTTFRIERLIDASPDAVFDAWTTREAMERWYADGDDFVASVLELDVRVGGSYRIEFGPAGATPYVEYGEYLEVDRPHLLAMTETLEGVEAPWRNTRVTVELHDDDGKTRLVLIHEGFPTTAHRDLASGGWPGFLERIAALLA